MLPNQLFQHMDRMGRVIQGMSLLDRLFRRKKPEQGVVDLPDYLENPNLIQLKEQYLKSAGRKNDDRG